MDTYNMNDGIIKATAPDSQMKVGQSIYSMEMHSEPLQQYITEFRDELRMEMAGISKIKW